MQTAPSALITRTSIALALRVDTRKWMAGKLAPKKYGEKVTQEITGNDGGPIEMSDADRAKLVAALFAERTVKEKQADGNRI
jgi:hypothetical protein